MTNAIYTIETREDGQWTTNVGQNNAWMGLDAANAGIESLRNVGWTSELRAVELSVVEFDDESCVYRTGQKFTAAELGLTEAQAQQIANGKTVCLHDDDTNEDWYYRAG